MSDGYIKEIDEGDCRILPNGLVVSKSKPRYEKIYNIFKQWLDEKKVVILELC